MYKEKYKFHNRYQQQNIYKKNVKRFPMGTDTCVYFSLTYTPVQHT